MSDETKLAHNEWLRDGNTIFELDDDGVNKWYCQVHPCCSRKGYQQNKELAGQVINKMTAASDMYKVLEEVLEYFPVGSACMNEQDESIQKARDALAKARGE